MADSSVSVKMGVTGIAQFKTSMNQAKQSVKTLDAELALNEKQFKQTGDAQEYMQQKSELLKKKLEDQKKVIENAEKALENMKARGVDQSSTAFQKMQQELVKAKSDLIDTENKLNGVADAGDKVSDGVSEMNSNLKRIGDGVNYQNVTDGLQKITDGMKSVINRAWNMGKAIVNATLGAGSWADELATTAAQYEIEPEHLYRMRETARLIDTDADTILTAQDKMRKGIEKAQKDPMGALAYLGVDPTDKSWDDIFWEAGEAIAMLGDEEDKVAYSNALFGKSWRELLPLFQAGRDTYDETMGQWSWIGDEGFENLTKMDDAYQQLESEWEAFQRKFESAMAPTMTKTMEVITSLLQEFNDYLSSEDGKEMLELIGTTISDLITSLVNVDPESVVSGLSDIITKISNALQWISDNKQTVVTAIEAIGIAFGGLQLASLATNIWRVVDGARNLLGLGGQKGVGTGAETASESLSETAVKSGKLTGLSNMITGVASKTSAYITANGLNNLIPVVGDMFMNQTNMGRALRDGENVLEGLNKDIEETKANIEKNASTFQEDWANNVIYKFFKDAGDRLRDAEQYAEEQAALKQPGPPDKSTPTENWEYGDDWSIEEILADIGKKNEKMAEAAEDLTGANSDAKKSTSEMATAAGTMKGLPGAMEAAIRSALSQMNIYLDGQSVGNVMTPYVSQGMGSVVKAITR